MKHIYIAGPILVFGVVCRCSEPYPVPNVTPPAIIIKTLRSNPDIWMFDIGRLKEASPMQGPKETDEEYLKRLHACIKLEKGASAELTDPQRRQFIQILSNAENYYTGPIDVYSSPQIGCIVRTSDGTLTILFGNNGIIDASRKKLKWAAELNGAGQRTFRYLLRDCKMEVKPWQSPPD